MKGRPNALSLRRPMSVNGSKADKAVMSPTGLSRLLLTPKRTSTPITLPAREMGDELGSGR